MAREFKTGITLPQGTLDIRALSVAEATELGSGEVDAASDLIPIYDASGSIVKKVAPANLGIGGGGGGLPGAIRSSGAGFFFAPHVNADGYSGTAALTSGVTLLVPVWVCEACDSDAIAIYVDTASSGNTIRLGIYTEGSGYGSFDRVLDCGTVDISTTGQKTLTFTPTAVESRIYWAALATNAAAMFLKAHTLSKWAGHHLVGGSNLTTGMHGVFSTSTSYHSAMPSSITGAVTNSFAIPLVGLRKE